MYYAFRYAGDAAKALDAFERYSGLQQRLMDRSFEQQVNISQVRFDIKLRDANGILQVR